MYNLHDDFQTFYRDHVCLGKSRRDALARWRDACMVRLENGLIQLGYPVWRSYVNQGGYAMHTLNQAIANNYDLDAALIFNASDLPAAPLAARQRIRAGFIKTGGQFKEDPTARTNAVTVWYNSGEHLDFAVFRSRVDGFGNLLLEHASGDEWKPRDPEAVTDWFDDVVALRSPSAASGASVKPQQLRRIVRFVKFLTRARSAWRLPGGMITTALVTEPAVYVADIHRDDVALYRTLTALHFRLTLGTAIFHPTEGKNLTEKLKRQQEVANLRVLLDELMPKLAILTDPSCTRAQARNAWRQFFNHAFWEAANDQAKPLFQSVAASVAPAVAFGDAPRIPTKEVGFG